MPIPLKNKVKNYDNTLVGQLIRYVENPDSLDYINGRWYSPKYDPRYKKGKYDPNNIGMGIDRNTNEYLLNGELAMHRDNTGREYLTELEERNARNHTLANAEDSYNNRLAYAQKVFKTNKVPSEMKKALTMSAIYNLGQGRVSKELFEDRALMNSFLNGSNIDYSNRINAYFDKYNRADRGPKTNEYIQKYGNRKSEGGSLRPSWDDLSLTEKSEMMKVAIKNGITDLATIRQKYNEFAEGGPEDITDKITYRAQHDIPEVTISAPRLNDWAIASNDAVWNPYVTNNKHLDDKVIKGAKAHAAWVKEHPVMDATGMVLGAAPLAVAAAPAIEGISALGEAAYAGYQALPWVGQQLLSKGALAAGTAIGLNNFLGPEGIRKTARLFNEGKYGDAALSTVGDAFNLSMAVPMLGLAKTATATLKPIADKTISFVTSPLVTKANKGSSISSNIRETQTASERGREILLDWINGPYYKQRVEEGPLFFVSNAVRADANKLIKEVPFDFSKTSSDLNKLYKTKGIRGITTTRPSVLETVLPDGTEVRNLNTGLDINIASDLGKDAENTALHELLHYMTSNSMGKYVSKAGEKVIDRGWLNPNKIYFDVIKTINKNRSKGWQDYVVEQNNALLPEYDNWVTLVMEKPKEAEALYLKTGLHTPESAAKAVQTLKNKYSYWYDIQEQRAYLQDLFLQKIRPNLKNPNDAKEIEKYLTEHPEILKKSIPYQHIQEVRPGSIRDYSKYFATALGFTGAIPIIKNTKP